MVDKSGPGLFDRRKDAVPGAVPGNGSSWAGASWCVSDDGQGRWQWFVCHVLFGCGQGQGGRQEQLLSSFTRDPAFGGPDPPRRDVGGASITRPGRHHVARCGWGDAGGDPRGASKVVAFWAGELLPHIGN